MLTAHTALRRRASRRFAIARAGAALAFALADVAMATDAGAQLPAEPRPSSTQSPIDPLLAPPAEAPRVIKSWGEALAIVRAQSADYLRSSANVRRAEAQSKVALAGLLPSLVGQGTFTHQFITVEQTLGDGPITIPSQDVLGAGATLTWAIGSPRAWHAIGTASRNVDAAKSDLADKRRTIAQTLVTSMLATLAAARAAELSRSGLRAAIERLVLTEAKVRLQSATEIDLDRAQADVDTARAVVITGDEALRQSREALGVALGSPVAFAASGDLDLGALEQAVASTCRLNDQIERRADVVAARTRSEIAERAVTDAHLAFAPIVSVQSQLAWGTQVLYGPTTTWNLQGVLTVPIWDGGARSGYLRDAEAAADQANQALVLARLNAIVGDVQAKRAVSVSAAALDVARRQRETAQRIDRRTRELYMYGGATSLELVTSAQALRAADINLVGFEFQAAQAGVLAILSNADCAF